MTVYREAVADAYIVEQPPEKTLNYRRIRTRGHSALEGDSKTSAVPAKLLEMFVALCSRNAAGRRKRTAKPYVLKCVKKQHHQLHRLCIGFEGLCDMLAEPLELSISQHYVAPVVRVCVLQDRIRRIEVVSE
jgi:hypothetical protein